MMAKKIQIRQYAGVKEVWSGRGAGSKVKKQVKFAQKTIPGENWYAERGTTMFWNPKKGKATPRKWWSLAFKR